MATKKNTSTEQNETMPSVLTLVKQPTKPPYMTSGKRLRASIIEGTLGKDAGPYPTLPANVQRVVDKKALELSSEACDLIRESIVRQIGNKCFYGLRYETFNDDEALEIAQGMTLDKALAPVARYELKRARDEAGYFLRVAQNAVDKIDRELQRLSKV